MAVTLNDIAAKVGMTHVTVSMALRNNPRVAKSTRAKIKQVAEELGYTENLLARSLVLGKTFTIGILVHSLKYHFFVDFFALLDDECFNAGYTAMFANSEFTPAREARHLKNFLSRKVDGLVIAQDPGHRNEGLLETISEHGIPIVTVGELPGSDLKYSNVAFDNQEGVRLAAEHIYRMGHRKVMYFYAGKAKETSAIIHRLHWTQFSAAWQGLTGGAEPWGFETSDTVYGGNELAEYLAGLPAEKRPTAVVCATDPLAISLMSALRVHKISVPNDISVMGNDDLAVSAEQPVPLTTVRYPVKVLAGGVWEILQQELQRPEKVPANHSPENRMIMPELIVRQSVQAKE